MLDTSVSGVIDILGGVALVEQIVAHLPVCCDTRGDLSLEIHLDHLVDDDPHELLDGVQLGIDPVAVPHAVLKLKLVDCGEFRIGISGRAQLESACEAEQPDNDRQPLEHSSQHTL